MKFIRYLIIHMRPYLLYVSGMAGISGMSMSNGSLDNLMLFLLGLSFFLGYGFGQALTDCFQVDTDSISSPYRPLSRGIVSKEAIGTASILGLISIGIIIVLCNFTNLYLSILSVVGLATYTHFKKSYWLGGPIWNSWIVSLLPIMGFLALNQEMNLFGISSNSQLWNLLIFNFLAYSNFVLIGYLKDINADKETNYYNYSQK